MSNNTTLPLLHCDIDLGHMFCSLVGFPCSFRKGTAAQLKSILLLKIDGVVCPPNISETVAGRLMKLAHRHRIASTTIKLISKQIYCPFLSILVKTIQRIVADPDSGKRFSQSELSSTTAVARTTFRLDRFRKSKPFTQCHLMS